MQNEDKEILEGLITESTEHLETIEPDLLTIEKESGQVSVELINRIFRAMHNIKGGFGFFGMSNIKELSHAMESVLMKVRDGEMMVTPAFTDALFAGVDKLRLMFNDVEGSQTISIQEELAPLHALLSSKEGKAPKKPTSQAKKDQQLIIERYSVPIDKIRKAIGKDKNLFSITTISTRDLAEKNRTPTDIFNKLNKVGEIIGSCIDFSAITGLDNCMEQEYIHMVLYVTAQNVKQVSKSLDIPKEQIMLLDHLALDIVDIEEESLDNVEARQSESAASAEQSAPEAEPEIAKAIHSTPKKKPDVKMDGSQQKKNISESNESIRVKVDILNRLMNLAGELVLGRNQIKQALNQKVSDAISHNAKLKRFDFELQRSRKNILTAIDNMLSLQEGNGAEHIHKEINSSNMLANKEDLNILIEREFNRISETFRKALSFNLIEITGMAAVVQNVDIVASELQSDIMNTRMQPVGTVFSKFPRIIRDMCKRLGKEIELSVEGGDVELDKSIIEALPAPLTHLIRNSADHGIEMPKERERKGKPLKGKIHLQAYHEGGQVNIDITDDGAGIDAEKLRQKAVEKGILIQEEASIMNDMEALNIVMMPGFSTAEAITDISGRGVGMDVVNTNIEKLGGTVEIESELGNGTRMNLKLPLTLAIIPSLIVSIEDRSFAIPQVSLEEMVRIRARDVSWKIENVQGKPVLRLREKLLPLVRLNEVLGIPKTYIDINGNRRPDKRQVFSGRRQKDIPDYKVSESEVVPQIEYIKAENRRSSEERRQDPRNALNILVLKVGPHRYGLVVEKLLNNEEIVVKPLSNYLKKCKFYAGATIMGDGRVAMILDAVGIADTSGLHFGGNLEKEVAMHTAHFEQQSMTEIQSLLLFRNGTSELFALNLELVARVEKVQSADIERVGYKEYLKYVHVDKGIKDYSLRILRLHDFLPVQKPEKIPEEFFVIVPKLVKRPMGIVVTELEDIVKADATINRENIKGAGIVGSSIIDGKMAIILNIYSLFETAEPEIYRVDIENQDISGRRILLAEDTEFFRTVQKDSLESFGLQVDVAVDGMEAWEKLSIGTYDLLITDIVMPRMNGIELTKRIRSSDSLMNLPVIALTSLANETDRNRIMAAGVNAYENKFDKGRVRTILTQILGKCNS